MKPNPTIAQSHLICGTANVSMPSLQKYLAGERIRPGTRERIEAALNHLGIGSSDSEDLDGARGESERPKGQEEKNNAKKSRNERRTSRRSTTSAVGS